MRGGEAGSSPATASGHAISMELDERNRKVLQAVIDSYIAGGLPIGSTLIVKKYNLGVSSATIRNIMAELEEFGLLTHPHTSAGRIPTDRGYRYYIDSLLSVENDAEDLPDHLRQTPPLQGEDLHALMEEASKFLAALSHCAGVVVAPSEPEARYRHIEFVRLHGHQVLIIFVTDSGVVQNKLIDLDETLTQQELNRFSSYLGEELAEHSLSEVRNRLVEQIGRDKMAFTRLLEETYRASQEVRERESERVYIGGASQVLDTPEFATVEKMRVLFKAFEDKYRLLQLLDRSTAAEGIKVFIGSENPFYEMQGCSLVVGNYRAGGNVVGALGVIGPTRMQYRQVIRVVDYTAKLLTKLLAERMQRGIER